MTKLKYFLVKQDNILLLKVISELNNFCTQVSQHKVSNFKKNLEFILSVLKFPRIHNLIKFWDFDNWRVWSVLIPTPLFAAPAYTNEMKVTFFMDKVTDCWHLNFTSSSGKSHGNKLLCDEENVIIFILTQYLGHFNNSRSFQEHAKSTP